MRINRATHIPYSNHPVRTARPAKATGLRLGVVLTAMLLAVELVAIYHIAAGVL